MITSLWIRVLHNKWDYNSSLMLLHMFIRLFAVFWTVWRLEMTQSRDLLNRIEQLFWFWKPRVSKPSAIPWTVTLNTLHWAHVAPPAAGEPAAEQTHLGLARLDPMSKVPVPGAWQQAPPLDKAHRALRLFITWGKTESSSVWTVPQDQFALGNPTRVTAPNNLAPGVIRARKPLTPQ